MVGEGENGLSQEGLLYFKGCFLMVDGPLPLGMFVGEG